MRILAFDTATAACSAAHWLDGAVTARRFEPMATGHAERLVPMITDVLADAGARFGDIDLIALSNGPGAFTGLRIAVATARGLALAAGVPAMAVTTLDAVARGVSADARAGRALLVAMESKRNDVYAQVFGSGLAARSEIVAVAPEALADLVGGAGNADGGGPLLVAGDAAARAVDALGRAGVAATAAPGPGLPDAAVVAEIAAGRWAAGTRPDAPPAPIYLRPPDATVPKAGGRLRP